MMVFSHIVQKRLSQENENVATEALAFIVQSSEAARNGLMKLLRGIAPDLPSLRFQTQQTAGDTRPDMWGFDGGTPRVLIENKFWAGLTDNQPVEYLKLLTGYSSPAVLLVVVPESRVETVSREFTRRLREASASITLQEGPAAMYRVEAISFGPLFAVTPILAITSWTKVLSAIEAELTDDPLRRNDLLQLRSLCDAADDYTFFNAGDLTDQRIPSLLLQLNEIIQRAVDIGVTEGVLSTKRLNPTHFWEGAGRYMRLSKAAGVAPWFGTDFNLWKKRGSTPIWLRFSDSDGGRALEVQSLLERWAERNNVATFAAANGDFSLGIYVLPGEEFDRVVRSIVDQLNNISMELTRLPARPEGTP